MKILVINPNTTESMTNSVVTASQRFVPDDVEIIGATSAFGPPSIEGYYDEVFSIPPMLEKIDQVIKSRDGDIDGVVVACFDDTGVDAARSMLEIPVIGICQAAMQTASVLANSFSIVTTLGRSVPALEHLVVKYGYDRLCKNVLASEIPVLALDQEGSDAEKTIGKQIELARDEDRAEAIVLGCAGMVDLTERLSNKYQIPVIEGVVPAVNTISGIHRAGLKTAKNGGYAAPTAKSYTGDFGKYSPKGAR